MTDYYSCLRHTLSEFCSSVLCADIPAESFFLCPRGYAARCSAPLRYEPSRDGSCWANELRAKMDGSCLFGVRLIEEVMHAEGHILFRFTDKFYTAAITHILLETPKTAPLPPYDDRQYLNARNARERALIETAVYTQRRMWMLSREANRIERLCPAYESVQRALLLCMGLTEKGIGCRAMFRRLEIACEALLSMSYIAAPRERPLFLRSCAYVGDAAFRLLVQWHAHWQQV